MSLISKNFLILSNSTSVPITQPLPIPSPPHAAIASSRHSLTFPNHHPSPGPAHTPVARYHRTHASLTSRPPASLWICLPALGSHVCLSRDTHIRSRTLGTHILHTTYCTLHQHPHAHTAPHDVTALSLSSSSTTRNRVSARGRALCWVPGG